MENTDGNASTPGRMESADGSSEADAVPIFGDPLEFVEACLERAIDRLTYGRRQEAEEGLGILKDAQAGILAHRRATGKRKQGG